MFQIQLCKHEHCTGCMACKQICSQNAIGCINIDGFTYPQINTEKCVECGLCMKTCPVLNISGCKGNTHEQETSCLAVYNKVDELRMKSSSGGSFSTMAEKILSEGGIVYGAAWNNQMNLIHCCADNVHDLDKLRRSKYVQSDTRNTYNEVRAYLKEGRKVLYSGTPCQIAGLHSFLLGKKYDNLILVDVLCQGVPSPWSFKKYIKEMEDKMNSKIVDCNFRTKEYGWRCGLLLLLRDKQSGKMKVKKLINKSNSFYRAFIREYFMRPSCYDCPFKNNNQGYYGDITIADFWRIGNKTPFNEKNVEKGVSALIINTEKGNSFFNACKSPFVVIERTWQEFSTNGGLRCSHKPKNNDEAFEYLKNHSWEETQAKFFPVTFTERVKVILKMLITERMIRQIKKLFYR